MRCVSGLEDSVSENIFLCNVTEFDSTVQPASVTPVAGARIKRPTPMRGRRMAGILDMA